MCREASLLRLNTESNGVVLKKEGEGYETEPSNGNSEISNANVNSRIDRIKHTGNRSCTKFRDVQKSQHNNNNNDIGNG